MNGTWRITLLGEMRARRGEKSITRFNSQKTAGLLAYLAYHLKQIHSREILLDIFWPDSTPEAGRNSLSVALSTLRSQLEPPGTLTGAVIRADRYSVGLNPSAVSTDVIEFETALQAAAKTASRTEQIQFLSQALDLYTGRFLPGYYEEWIRAEEERLSGRYFDAASQLLTHLEEAGDLPAALAYARKAVSIDPLREEIQLSLIRLLMASGQPAAALRQYRELERLLEEELGEEPSAALRALIRQIERQTGLAAPILPAPVVRPPVQPTPGFSLSSPEQPITLTFLLTDIAGSTGQWERTGEVYKAALATHHATLRRQFSSGGQEIKEAGDAFVVAFQSAKRALECAAACQQALREQEWPEQTGALQVRMALHTGDVEYADGDYRGLALHRASRMLTAAHGGQILVSEATSSLVRRDLEESGLRLVDLGVYRLRDIASPERLFQVEYPQMPERQFGPLAAEAGYVSHLPLRFTRFFGRKQEIARLRELLLSPEVRLVTLLGIGGTGKTRLSLEAAEHLEKDYAGAVWFVPLVDIQDPALIAPTILGSLRIPLSPHREPLEQVMEALGKQPSLLVLDNMEQLVEGGAQVVQTLLERVPDLKILVTSRQNLGLAAEQEYALSPLPTPNGEEELESLRLYESVELFIDRAQQVKPDFQVTNANAAAMASLVDGLEGIPLAIELAAARAQVFTPSQMLSQLSQRFGFLVSRRRDMSERHRTLRAAVEWSYRLLSPELQRFFCRLSVFRGGWTIEAAEEVCEEPLALDYLALLRECSLVLTDDSGEQMRFWMLETLREYGAEQLRKGDQAATRLRHAECFLSFAQDAMPQLNGPEQRTCLERLEADHDNFRAALGFLLQEPEAGELGLRLTGALQQFWSVRGHLSEGMRWTEAILTHPGTQERTRPRAIVINGAGNLAWNQGDYNAARLYSEEGLSLHRELGNQKSISISLNNLGNVAVDQGDYPAARAYFEQCLAMDRESGNRAGISCSLNNLGNVAYNQGDHVAARIYYEESLALDREIGNSTDIATSLDNLGNVTKDQGDYLAARAFCEESLALSREIGDKLNIAHTLNHLGEIAHYQGDYHAAQAFCEESLALSREVGDRKGIAGSLNNLGKIAHHQGDYLAARAFCEEGLALSREIGHRRYISVSLNNLGEIAHAQNDYRTARTYQEESLALCRELGDRLGLAEALGGFGALAAIQGEPKRAVCLYAAMQALRLQIGAPLAPKERQEMEKHLGPLRTQMGEEAFAADWEQGSAMPLEQILLYLQGLEGDNTTQT